MSSTARGGQRSPADFYETPAWATYHAITAIHRRIGLESLGAVELADEPLRILEPCAGRGAIVRAAHAMISYYRPRLEQRWTAIEMESHGSDLSEIVLEGGHSIATITGMDFFYWLSGGAFASAKNRPTPFDLVIMNPPFRHALEFIQSCFSLAPHILSLERLNFFGGADRAEFMRASRPGAFVMPNRVSFISPDLKKGSTDSIEYAWFLWSKSSSDRGFLEVLPAIPKELRVPLDKFQLTPSPEEWDAYIAGVREY
jgi:hypothetical protein